MKIRMTIVGDISVTTPILQDEWPGCKTIQDVAKLQQQYYNEGATDLYNLLDCCPKITVSMEGIE